MPPTTRGGSWTRCVVPTLDELRRLLREGIGVTKVRDIREGAVDWDLSGEADHLDNISPLDLAKMAAARDDSKGSPPKYTMSADGTDAIIRFGKHKGKELKMVYAEDPSYLAWLIKEFRGMGDKASRDFVDICENIVRGT
jgi:hypothetical protein